LWYRSRPLFTRALRHVYLSAGETGLQSDSAARAEDVTTLRKVSLVPPRDGLRKIGEKRLCELAAKVSVAMGCPALI
jgi:mRNA-degrading endonuclease toxin of MazEF toxin-antitoxin module